MSLKRTLKRQQMKNKGYLAERRRQYKKEKIWQLKEAAKYAHLDSKGKRLLPGK